LSSNAVGESNNSSINLHLPFSGDFEEAIKNFDKALELVRTESEMAQTFSIRQAALAQKYVTKEIGLTPPRMF
jgi:hypothetical protein